MTENPHETKDLSCEDEKLCEEKTETDKKSSWSEDQKARGYYYDDAHGYEIYNPEEEEEEKRRRGEEEIYFLLLSLNVFI